MNELKKSNETTTAAVQGEITRAMAKTQGIIQAIEQDVTNGLTHSVDVFESRLEQSAKELTDFFQGYKYILFGVIGLNILSLIGLGLSIFILAHKLHACGF